jgi:hypothetical protein
MTTALIARMTGLGGGGCSYASAGRVDLEYKSVSSTLPVAGAAGGKDGRSEPF